MPGASDLKVRVGLVFDEKSLAGIERSMRGAGQRLSRIGTDLSLSLSLPLAAFGATAIKAAGDMESLTLALKSQLGTADAAAKELEKLTEAAKNPGLGVEQAVRGSIRLQGVGLAADEARQILIQMGNAIASTGGTATELDAVTRQFSQMISKGRVLQEDVSILSENMPGLAGLMQKAFGTQSVEAIRKMGVSGKEFVLRITEMAKELPRVEGGIKNGIGNAIDSLKQSAAKVGLAINEAFDVTGAIETISGAVLFLAQGFSNLDPWLKKTILGIAGIAIATGPLIKAWGAMQLLGSQMVSLWSGLVGVGKSVVAGLQAMRAAFFALNAATQAFLLIGILTAVTAIAVAFSNYQSELTDTEKAQRSLLEVQQKGADAIAGQKSEVDTLVNAYKAEGATLKQKQAILSELNKISPEYFGAIKVGKGDVEALTIATARYSAELLKVAQITAAKDRLVEIEKALLGLNKTAEPSILQTFGNILRSNGNAAKFAGDQVSSYTGNINAAKSALTAERDALVGLVTQSTLADAATGKLSKSTAGLSDSAKKTGSVLKEVIADITKATETAKLLGEPEDIAKIEALRKGIERLIDAGFKPASAEVQNLKAQLDALATKPHDVVIDIIRREGGSVAPAPPSLQPVSFPAPDLKQTQALADAWRDVYIGAAQQITDTISGLFSDMIARNSEAEINDLNSRYAAQISAAEGNAALQEQLQADLQKRITDVRQQAARKQKRLAIAEAVINTAVAVTKALTGAIPPFNIPLAVAAGIAGAAQIATIAAQPLARGTGDFGGGTALVGERGPELLTLPKHTQVSSNPRTNQILSGMGDGGTIVGGTVRFDGRDMYLMIEKQDQIAKRTRGYGLNG